MFLDDLDDWHATLSYADARAQDRLHRRLVVMRCPVPESISQR